MWLKAVGKGIAKGIQIAGQVSGILPQLQQIIPAIPPQTGVVVQQIQGSLEQVAGIIVTVEAIGESAGLKGPDKLKAAAPLVAQAIQQSSLLAGKTIADPVLFAQGCSKIADGMVDVLNSLKAPVE